MHSALELTRLLGGVLEGADVPVSGFALDSRSVQPGNAFLAIAGEKVDGHEYVAQALAGGASLSVVERPVVGSHILVTNLVEALAKMAGTLRDGFDGPVVGITGSAGKTTVKELTAAALSPLGNILKTPGNRNTEYTVPLVWTELDPSHQAAIIEMSMRGFGQIAHLAKFCRPNIGVVTNVGFSHIEMVGDRQGIARAKGELLEALPKGGVAILWHEDEFLETLREMAPWPVLTFGFGHGAMCRITAYRPIDWRNAWVAGEVDGMRWETTLPAVGRHVATGAAAAMLVAYVCGVDPMAAAAALPATELPPMRMEIQERDEVTFVVDTYNAAPPSMIAALETLAEMPVVGRRRAVIGEMRELGDQTEASHRLIGETLRKLGIRDVVFFGEPMRAAMDALGAGVMAAEIRDVRDFVRESRPGDVVLIKGSRSLELERALI